MLVPAGSPSRVARYTFTKSASSPGTLAGVFGLGGQCSPTTTKGETMKRVLTAEQQAKRDARRAQFRALWKQVASMPELDRIQLANKYGLRTVEGHELSLCNTVLIVMQNPTATVLGGFRQWIKQGRAVMKGQHGCMIWVPTGTKKADSPEATTPTEPINGESESDTRFIIGTVFDIAQTQEIESGATADQEQAA